MHTGDVLEFAVGVVIFSLVWGAAGNLQGYGMFFQLAGIEPLSQVVLRPLQDGLMTSAYECLSSPDFLFSAGPLTAGQSQLVDSVRVLDGQIEVLGMDLSP